MPHIGVEARMTLAPVAARLAIEVGELTHALQRERGASVMHLLSPARRRSALERAWAVTDAAVRQLVDTLGRNHAVLPRRAVEPFADMRTLLEVRPCLQATVTAREVPAREVVARYSAIIGLVLTALDECAELVAEPALGRRFDAHRALLRAEEEASLARAYGTLVLAGLAPNDPSVLSRLLAQEQLHLAEFAAGTLPHIRTVLRDRLQQPAFQRADQLERLTAAVGPHRELVTSDEWYATLTAKLRALREVTDLDASGLLEQAAARPATH